jgi:hypothetical protein
MKKIFSLLCLVCSLSYHSHTAAQTIRIDRGGDDWSCLIEEALVKIAVTDQESYRLVVENVERISMITGDRSTNEPLPYGRGTVYICTADLKSGLINNIAAALVHESYHLSIWRLIGRNNLNRWCSEEITAYRVELAFIQRLPDAEPFLAAHCLRMIQEHRSKISRGECR